MKRIDDNKPFISKPSTSGIPKEEIEKFAVLDSGATPTAQPQTPKKISGWDKMGEAPSPASDQTESQPKEGDINALNTLLNKLRDE